MLNQAKASAEDSAEILRAVHFAAAQHHGQLRSGEVEEPYLVHLLEVAELVATATGGETRLTIAALLHDVLEDTKATHDDLARSFGPEVADLVAEVTDAPGQTREARKAAQAAAMPKKSPGARIIKLADLLSNTRNLLAKPPRWPRRSIRDYAEANHRVFEAGRGANPYLEELWDDMWPALAAELEISASPVPKR